MIQEFTVRWNNYVLCDGLDFQKDLGLRDTTEHNLAECIRRSPAAAGAVVNGSSAVTAAAV